MKSILIFLEDKILFKKHSFFFARSIHIATVVRWIRSRKRARPASLYLIYMFWEKKLHYPFFSMRDLCIYKCIILQQCVWYVHRFIKADTSSVGQPPSVVGGSIEYLMGLTYVYSVLCMWWWLKGPTTRSWPPNGKNFFFLPFWYGWW